MTFTSRSIASSRFDAADPKGDRGGNNVKITGNTQPPVCDDPRYCPFGPPSELHAFFDDIAGSGYAVAPVEAAATTLPRTDTKKVAISDVAVWIQEGFELAQSAVYVAPIGVGDGPFHHHAAVSGRRDQARSGAHRACGAAARKPDQPGARAARAVIAMVGLRHGVRVASFAGEVI